jgi:hypothetical protein
MQISGTIQSVDEFFRLLDFVLRFCPHVHREGSVLRVLFRLMRGELSPEVKSPQPLAASIQTIQARPKDLPVLLRQPERAVSWHAGMC